MQPQSDAVARTRAALGLPPDRRSDAVRAAPAVPDGFYGQIAFEYQAGRCVLATVTETVKVVGKIG